MTLLGKTEYCHQHALHAYENQELPLDIIVETCGVKRIKGVNPLVQVLFVMNNVPTESLDIDTLQFENFPLKNQHSKFDMGLFVTEHENSLVCNWAYSANLFTQKRIEQMKEGWVNLLEQLAKNPNALLGEFVMPNMQYQPNIKKLPDSKKSISKKLNKLSQFIKKINTSELSPKPMVRFSPLHEGEVFPLLAEPAESDMNVIEWAKNSRQVIDDNLAKHGCILFRDFGLNSIQEFEQFAEAIHPGLYGNYGDLPKY